MTREEWLEAAFKALDAKFFNENGYELPKTRVSCGWPKAGGSKCIGQCFYPEGSADETTEIFISPEMDDSARVLDILLHEMIHASTGPGVGHKGIFRKMAKEFGLEGKMTATTVSDGSELHITLTSIIEKLDKYPHAKLTHTKKVTKTNKWVRYVSTTIDTYKVVVSLVSVAEWGVPRDPLGKEMVPVNG